MFATAWSRPNSRSAAPRLNALRLYPAGAGLAALAVAGGIASLGAAHQQIKVILALCGLGILLVIAVRPHVGIPILVFIAPFDVTLRLPGYGSQLHIYDLLLWVTAIFALRRLSTRSIGAIPLLGLLLVLAGGSFAAQGAVSEGSAWLGVFRWAAALVVVLSVPRDFGAKGLHRLQLAVAANAVILVMFALMQRSGIFFLVGAPFSAGRVDSFFGYYTQFAAYCAMAALLLMAGLPRERPSSRVLRLLGLLSALTGVGISLSRGALLSLIVGLAVALILAVRSPRFYVRAAVALAVGAGILVSVLGDAVEAFRQRFAQPFGAVNGDVVRLAAQSAGRRILVDHPAGIGYGNFQNFYIYALDGYQSRLAHAQSLPIQVGLDIGVVGLAGLLLIFGWAIWRGTREALRSGRSGYSLLAACAVGSIGGYFAQGWGEYLLLEPAFFLITLLPVLFIASIPKQEE